MNVDIYDDNVSWLFGDFFNNFDGVQDSGDQIVFEVVVCVVDEVLNMLVDDDFVNMVIFIFIGGLVDGMVFVDFVEFELILDKCLMFDLVFVDVGDIFIFEFEIDYMVLLIVDVFFLEIIDVFVGGMFWVGNVMIDCLLLLMNVVVVFMIVFIVLMFILVMDICMIFYDVIIDSMVLLGEMLINMVMFQYDF